MKILGSTINLTSRHAFEATETRQESLRVWRDALPETASPVAEASIEPLQADHLTISRTVVEAYQGAPTQAAEDTSPIAVDAEFFGLTPDDRILISILERALGIRIRTEEPSVSLPIRVEETMAKADGVVFERRRGIVNTADGEQIAIQAEFNMDDSYLSPSCLVDPIAIDYDGRATDLRNLKFLFNLNSDGDDRIQIWSRDNCGADRLVALGEKETGVVYVGNIKPAPVTRT